VARRRLRAHLSRLLLLHRYLDGNRGVESTAVPSLCEEGIRPRREGSRGEREGPGAGGRVQGTGAQEQVGAVQGAVAVCVLVEGPVGNGRTRIAVVVNTGGAQGYASARRIRVRGCRGPANLGVRRQEARHGGTAASHDLAIGLDSHDSGVGAARKSSN